VDDTYRQITETFNRDDFKAFSKFSEQFKIIHRCLDGIGINYSRDRILSVKAYCKILDSMPKFSDEFLRTFSREEEFRRELLSLSSSGSECMLNRNTGLAGINIGIKRDLEREVSMRSIYVKTDPKVSYVLNYNGKEIHKQRYNYIFNKVLKVLINSWFNFRTPRHSHALEFSKRKDTSFATIYPVFQKKPNQRPSSMRRQYRELFEEINKHDQWEIEGNILKTCSENFPLWTPITKGYESKGRSRKIYMGTFSYKTSAFKYFRH
jgi:hypothetical protein